MIGPVFVAGCPRSGTTALSWAIASHPGYYTAEETHFFYYLLGDQQGRLHRAFEQSDSPGSWLATRGICYDRFLYYLGVGLDRVIRDQMRSEAPDAVIWVDGSPENVLVGESLLTMFPTAHMFAVVRDPRAVCLSMLTSGFAEPWASDLGESVRTWRHYAQISIALAAARPDQVTLIRNECMRQRSAAVAALVGERLSLTEPDCVTRFLETQTLNSSFDKTTMAPAPHLSNVAASIIAEEFMAEYGPRIIDETADLASQLGYR